MRPDLVDVDQLIGRLGIDHAAFRRLQRSGAAPDPDRHFAGRPLWWWDHVEHWRKQRRRTGKKPYKKPTPTVDLVDLDGIARRLHVTSRVAERWFEQGRLIPPDYEWSFAHVWLWPSVEEWASSGRRPTAPPPPTARPAVAVEPAPQPPVVPEEPADDPAEPAPTLGELDALVARLDELEVALTEPAESERDEVKGDVLRQRMEDVARFIERIDG